MAYLALEDGNIFEGSLFGIKQKVIGEVVFNTSMTGYQEILTDPSYCGQIVTMTYPLIGNYGVNSKDPESHKPQAKGFIVRELCDEPNNFMSESTLDEYLKANNITAIKGVDTRALTRIIRNEGTLVGMITDEYPTDEEIKSLKGIEFHNPVDIVTTDKVYNIKGDGYKVGVMDFGLKQNILRSLSKRGCDLTVFPARTSAEEILSYNLDAIMLTNGPGDPKDNEEVIANIKKLMDKLPIFGICLGHQLLALASGGDTEKLKFGHRGANHPIMDLTIKKAYITSQNHGYSVIASSLDSSKAVVTHMNLNDNTVEGIEYLGIPVFGVQFHPEACPGPEDTAYLFDRFMENIKSNK